MRHVCRHQLLFLAGCLFWMSSVQAESSIDLIANYRTSELLETPILRDGFEGPVQQLACDYVTLTGNTVNWSEFWYEAFPGPVYENVTFYTIPRLGYLAIEFNTANFIDDGKISSLENPSTPGLRTGSISTCPGDFDVPAECRYTWGLAGGLTWSTNDKLGACALDSNTTYYFNITFTNGVDADSSTCNLTPCRINLQHANF